MMHSHNATANLKFKAELVLILVVMDDALAPQNKNIFHKKQESLNPCCNG